MPAMTRQLLRKSGGGGGRSCGCGCSGEGGEGEGGVLAILGVRLSVPGRERKVCITSGGTGGGGGGKACTVQAAAQTEAGSVCTTIVSPMGSPCSARLASYTPARRHTTDTHSAPP